LYACPLPLSVAIVVKPGRRATISIKTAICTLFLMCFQQPAEHVIPLLTGPAFTGHAPYNSRASNKPTRKRIEQQQTTISLEKDT
jgi:hypothetical protein